MDYLIATFVFIAGIVAYVVYTLGSSVTSVLPFQDATMRTYYVSASNGKVYRVKADNAQIAARYVVTVYHVTVVTVEQFTGSI